MVATPKKVRSPFSLSIPEVAAMVGAAALTWFANDRVFWAIEPFYRGYDFEARRQALFATWNPLIVAIAGFSAIFAVRALTDNVRHFSRTGNIAMAWPGIVYVPAVIVSYLYWFVCFPSGIIVYLLALVSSGVRRNAWGNLVAILVHLAIAIVFMTYLDQMWLLYGD